MKELKKIKEWLSYCPITGEFYWLQWDKGYRKQQYRGALAGCLKKDGGIHITINKKHYNASHLAFYFMTGDFPEKDKIIDHINGVRHDNRWENLRQVTRQQNQFNRKDQSIYGAGIRKTKKGFTVRLTFNKQRKSYYCKTLEEANIIKVTLLNAGRHEDLKKLAHFLEISNEKIK